VSGVNRRGALALGGAAVAAGALPAAAARAPATGVLLFDPRSAPARALAAKAQGERLVAVVGDPVRLWRDALADDRGPVRGLTRWSDYLLLRGLAEENGLRLRSETRVPGEGGAMIVDWRMA